MRVSDEKKKSCRRAAPSGLLGSLLAQSCCGLPVLPPSARPFSICRGNRATLVKLPPPPEHLKGGDSGSVSFQVIFWTHVYLATRSVSSSQEFSVIAFIAL